jgi:putative oxidoreductase
MDKTRTTNVFVVWTLTVVLTAVFLVAGIPKLTGADTVWLQAASMRNFPSFIRIVVGVVEVVCGLALLVPAIASYAAFCLAILMIPASITQLASGEPGVYVPLLLLLLLLLVAWLRDPATIRGVIQSATATPRPVLREGVVAGVIGATCVAVWFFVVDLAAGHALFTPITLGRALFTAFRATPELESPALYVIGYTVFHYAAFIVAGVTAAATVRWAGREPALLLGFAILFVAFEVGFYWFVALLQQASALGGLAWPQVMVGNLISAAAMGAYIWHAHPRLYDQLTHAFDSPS